MTGRKYEGDSMEDAPLNVNSWRTFNVPSLITIAATAIGMVTYINNLDARLVKVEEYRVTRSAATDAKFAEIETALAPLNNLPYRVDQNDKRNDAQDARMDRFTEAITGTMELIRKDVAGLSTKIEVLSSKVDALTPTKKASLDGAPSELAVH